VTLSPADSAQRLWELHTTRASACVPGDPVIVDVLRYTVVLPRAQYARHVVAMREALPAALNARLWDRKNFWADKQLYRGINDVLLLALPGARDWLWLEVQHHVAHTAHALPRCYTLSHAVNCRSAVHALLRLLTREVVMPVVAMGLLRALDALCVLLTCCHIVMPVVS
jgi:hypothetical protein